MPTKINTARVMKLLTLYCSSTVSLALKPARVAIRSETPRRIREYISAVAGAIRKRIARVAQNIVTISSLLLILEGIAVSFHIL
jgi:hypothetical protein